MRGGSSSSKVDVVTGAITAAQVKRILERRRRLAKPIAKEEKARAKKEKKAKKEKEKKEKKSKKEKKASSSAPSDDATTCKVCFAKKIDTVILECGHRVICGDCGKALSEKHSPCPMCRREITRLVHTYDS